METISPSSTMVDLSPAEKKILEAAHSSSKPRGRAHSLIGFDPLLSTPITTTSTVGHDGKALAMADLVPVPQSAPVHGYAGENTNQRNRCSAVAALPVAPFVSNEVPQTTPNTKQAKKSKTNRRHRKGAQTFCVSDLHAVNEQALKEEQQVMNKKGPTMEDLVAGLMAAPPHSTSTPPQQTKKGMDEKKSVTKSDLPPVPLTPPRKENGGIKKDPSHGTGEDKKKVEKKSPKTLSPMRKSLKLWGKKKKDHRRTKSLEVGSALEAAMAAASAADRQQEKNSRSPVPNSPTTNTRESFKMDSMVNDLMGLDYNNDMSLPSLSKPPVHSFLRGKSDEMLRTSELDPSQYQVQLPKNQEVLVMSRLCEFVESYRTFDMNMDLREWVGLSRMSLRQMKSPEHQPIAEALLDCGENVSLQGIVKSKGSRSADDRVEAVIFEGMYSLIFTQPLIPHYAVF